MKEYQNYIFDLYGTLIDIKTDEAKPSLWKKLAMFYNAYGCEWKGSSLRKAYHEDVEREKEILKARIQKEYAEIELKKVFVALLFESEKFHPTDMKIEGKPVDELRKAYAKSESSKEKTLKFVEKSEVIVNLANFFRIESTVFCRPYKNTVKVLKELKKRGKNIYLLSNAQTVFTMPEIEMSGVRPYLDVIYISSDCEIMKPQKEFMEKLLKEQGLKKSETVMIGNDPDSDVAVALKNDLDYILLNTWDWSKSKITKHINGLVKEIEPKTEHPMQVVYDGDIAGII